MTARALDLSAGAQFLDPKVLARIESLELLARVVVEGFISGLHRSPHLGLSVDFAEHRAYMPGDDIRRIDWRLFGRTDRHHVKEFEADTNTNVAVLLDVSPSMRFASGAISKLDYGRYLAACLAYFSHRQRDRVGLATFAEDVVDFVPPSAKHLPVVLHTLDRIGTRDSGFGIRDSAATGRIPNPESRVTIRSSVCSTTCTRFTGGGTKSTTASATVATSTPCVWRCEQWARHARW